MELKEIQNLIKFVAKSGANEVKLEMGDVKITIKTEPKDMKLIIFSKLHQSLCRFRFSQKRKEQAL